MNKLNIFFLGLIVMALAVVILCQFKPVSESDLSHDILNVQLTALSLSDAVVVKPIPNGDENYEFIKYKVSYSDESVSGKKFNALRDEIRKSLVHDSGIYMMCHNPGIGLAFLSKDRILLKVTVCFKCNNLGIKVLEEKSYPLIIDSKKLDSILNEISKGR